MPVPRTIEEARLGQVKLWQEHFREVKSQNLAAGKPAGRTSAEGYIEKFDRACYSLPGLRPEIEAWMIDFCWGCENPFDSGENLDEISVMDGDTAQKLVNMLAQGKKDEMVELTGGPLMGQVVKFLKDYGLDYTDAGGSGRGGHVGLPCTDAGKEFVMTQAYQKFGKAIDRGLLLVKVAWFKPRLFRNCDAAEAWYSVRGLIS